MRRTARGTAIARRCPGRRRLCIRCVSAAAGEPHAVRGYNGAMDYQLVIKLWRKSLADEAFLATIESELKQVLGDTVELEGYDTSPKEINLFMTTADPRQAFRRARNVLEQAGVVQGVSAAFRLVGGAQFTSIWPLRVTRKFTLP